MKKVFLSSLTVSICLFGCSKKQAVNALPTGTQNATSSTAHKEGGDDDDIPIVMEITKDTNGNPVSDVKITFINGNDTVSGLTDQNGVYILNLTSAGLWKINTSKSGYVCINDQANFTDSFTTRTDTLQYGQCE